MDPKRSTLALSIFATLTCIGAVGCTGGPPTDAIDEQLDNGPADGKADGVIRPVGDFWLGTDLAGVEKFSRLTLGTDHSFFYSDDVDNETTGTYDFSKSGDQRFILFHDEPAAGQSIGALIDRYEYTYDGRLLQLRRTPGADWVTMPRYLNEGEPCVDTYYDQCGTEPVDLVCKLSTSPGGASSCQPYTK